MHSYIVVKLIHRSVGGWVNRPVLRFQAATHTSGSSFCRAFLEPPALENSGSSGTQTESLSLSGAAGAACSRAEVPAVRALSSLQTRSRFGGGAAGAAMLFALPCPAPRARAFRSCLGLLLNLAGEGSTCKPRKEKGARAPLSVLLPSLEAAGGAGQLSDKICFPAVCRNTLAVWGKPSQEMQQLRDELARPAAEIGAMQKVMLHFGKEGWGEQGPAQGPSWASWWAFPAQPTHPSLARGCWLSFSAVKPLLLARSDVVVSPVPLCLSQEAEQMREAMSATTRMSDWALKSAGTERPQVQAGRARRTGLVLGVAKRRLRCRLCSPRQREVGRNHGAQEQDCGRAAPLGSPQSCCQTPRWCPGHAPDSISALSLSAELSWGTKAYG